MKSCDIFSFRISHFELHSELEKLFSPDLFIIGGGVSSKSEKFLPYLASKTAGVVEADQMRNEAGIIGAACLAIHPEGSMPAASR